jgi:hypothetical protein
VELIAPMMSDAPAGGSRKRHILTDNDGRLLIVRVDAAYIPDHNSGKLPLKGSRSATPSSPAPSPTAAMRAGSSAGRPLKRISSRDHPLQRAY